MRNPEMQHFHFSENFGDKIAVQLAAAGVIGALADKVVAVVLSMLASLLVGLAMEGIKYLVNSTKKPPPPPPPPPATPATNSGALCAVHPSQPDKTRQSS